MTSRRLLFILAPMISDDAGSLIVITEVGSSNVGQHINGYQTFLK